MKWPPESFEAIHQSSHQERFPIDLFLAQIGLEPFSQALHDRYVLHLYPRTQDFQLLDWFNYR